MLQKNIDILKYILSLFIVMIHVGWSVDTPFLRISVPTFFVISSYLFFSKLENKPSDVILLKKFLKRASLLYLFWFVVLLPTTLIIRQWLDYGFIDISKKIIYGIFFKATFPASWYLSAYMIGITIAYYMRKLPKLLLFLGVISFVICCLTTNYFYLLDNVPFGKTLQRVSDIYNLYYSFPVGILFIYFGMNISKLLKLNMRYIVGLFLLGVVLLYLESSYTSYFELRKCDDCYFSLIILAPVLVAFVLKLNNARITVKTSGYLRKMSTIIYCTHLTVVSILNRIIIGLDSYQCFILTFIICTIISYCFIKIQQFSYGKWVKYSY